MGSDEGEFARRLNLLFSTVYPPGGRPHTPAEVLAVLKGEGAWMSSRYLWQLRRGHLRNPSTATAAALARFFRVDVRYFTDDDFYERMSNDLAVLASLRDDGVRRLATRLWQQPMLDLDCEARALECGEGPGATALPLPPWPHHFRVDQRLL